MIRALAFGSGTEPKAVIWTIDTGFVSLEKVSAVDIHSRTLPKAFRVPVSVGIHRMVGSEFHYGRNFPFHGKSTCAPPRNSPRRMLEADGGPKRRNRYSIMRRQMAKQMPLFKFRIRPRGTRLLHSLALDFAISPAPNSRI